jgi:enoyl-[acyl-carrier protein] reductase II
LAPVRLIKNEFYDQVKAAYDRAAPVEELKEILGRARAKRGMFEGNLTEGELEIGQVSGQISDIKPAGQIVEEIIAEYRAVITDAQNGNSRFAF